MTMAKTTAIKWLQEGYARRRVHSMHHFGVEQTAGCLDGVMVRKTHPTDVSLLIGQQLFNC